MVMFCFCVLQGSAEEITEHERVHISDHLELITVYAGNTDLRTMDIRTELQVIKSQYRPAGGAQMEK